jgi:hypothetical protein
MREQVEAWRRSELTDVTATVVSNMPIDLTALITTAYFPLLTHHFKPEYAGGLIAAAAGFYTRFALYVFTLGRVRGG